jgi:putative FmdB family regulatory protein
MPTYEYRCKKCGEFEFTQRITAAALTRCPACRGKVTKLISNTSFQLKGSGWYATDYARKGGNGKDASSPSKSEGKAETASEGKAEKSGASETKTGKQAAAA